MIEKPSTPGHAPRAKPPLTDRVARQLLESVEQRRGTTGQLLSGSDVMRFTATLGAIPDDTVSILDAGCGLGVLTDCLVSLGYEARGVDIDPDAMRHMAAERDVGSIAALPYPSMSFDTVVANEVLEHLPIDAYRAAREELARVASRSIVVTVPNAEPLDAATTRCPGCSCIYSLHGHVRRFEAKDLADLLPGFELVTVTTTGPFKVRHRFIEWHLRRRFLGLWPARAGATCPQCGLIQAGQPASTELGASGSALGKAARTLLGFPWSRWWLVAVFRRSNLPAE